MEGIQTKKLNPITSLFRTGVNLMSSRIHFSKNHNGQTLTMNDGTEFEIFRHVVVGHKILPNSEKGAIFIVRFKLSKMSVEKNIKFSRLPIPMFIGLPGFRAKFWLLNRQTGHNLGIYQWKTEQDAIHYSRSFAVDFMAKRSIPGSVSYEIIPDSNIYEYIEGLKETKPLCTANPIGFIH